VKHLLSLALVALLALAIGANANAEPPPTAIAALQRRITWDEQHIRKLQHRRDVLHRFIAELRNPAPTISTPPTTSTASTNYSGGVLSASQVASYARGAGFPESAIPTMVAYAYRESHFDPGAINSSSGACGLWQIYPAQPGCTDPATNAALAFQKYQASGFSPWG
jgi:hypothetical protein